MIIKQFFLLPFFFTASFCFAQENGCFKAEADNTVSFETNIDLSRYDAFFVGEFHGVYGVPEIRLATIKYLNTHFGITDVFMEISYGAAYLYNEYLATGDTSFFMMPRLISSEKQTGMNFWERLYEYNKGLDHKITIRGMDFERAEFLKVLKMLMLPGKDKPAAIAATLSYIDTVNLDRVTREDDILDTVYEKMRAVMKGNRIAYEQYYGPNFKIVAGIMFNVNTFKKYKYRNKTMYHNMMEQIKGYGIKKFVTFNGAAHAMNSKGILCGDLKRSKAFKNKLADITLTCKNCYDFNGTWTHPGGSIKEFESPYRKGTNMDEVYDRYFNNNCRYTLLPSSVSDNKKVRKFSDYIILMKDQPKF